MEKVNLKFNQEKKKKDIDVVIIASEKDEQVQSLMGRISDPLSGTITVSDSEGSSVTLPETHIISISTDSKKLKVITADGEYELKLPLMDVEQQLDPSAFLRISRFEIINLGKVKRFDFPIRGALQIEMIMFLKDRAEVKELNELLPQDNSSAGQPS